MGGAPTRSRVAALVLAAGRASRMGSNKLLAPVGGVAMLARVCDAAAASRAMSVTVVTGHEAGRIREALAGRRLAFVHNPDHAQGMAGSLCRGLRALPDDAQAAIVLLADMPLIGATALDRLIAAFEAHDRIIVFEHAGRRGNPVLWPRRFFAGMCALAGDTGARALLDANRAEVHAIEAGSDAIFLDVDTPADLAALERR